MTDTFHLTEFKYTLESPHLDRSAEFKVGDVLRVFATGAFCHAVVLGFREDGECKLSRPYAYASGNGTTGPTVLLGAETYTMTANNMRHLATLSPRVGVGCVT